MNYYRHFKDEGKLNKVKEWLKENPAPKKCKGGKYKWAYDNIPVVVLQGKEF